MPRISRAESHAQTRTSLLKAAREVFVELGVNAASIDIITDRAGYSKGAFYSNFPSKEAIMKTLLEEHMAQEAAALRGVLESVNSLEEFFERLGTFYKWMHEDPSICILDVEYQLLAVRNADIRAQYAQLWKGHLAELTKLVDAASKRLNFRLTMRSADLLENVSALITGLVISRLTMPSKSAMPVHEVMLNYLRSSVQQ